MNYIIWLLFIFFLGCGSDETKTIQVPVEVPAKIEPTPTPTPPKEAPINPIIGSWVDAENHTLVFKEDFKVMINGDTFTYSIRDKYVAFLLNDIQIDLCAYEISTEGHLNEPIKAVLDLTCAESGKLKYTRSNSL